MRQILLGSCLFLAVSVGSAKTMAAVSPDCDRWIREYKQALANSRPVHHARRHLAHVFAKPKPVTKPHLVRASIPVHHVRPIKLTPQEMLKRFRILCGDDLPEDVPAGLLPPLPGPQFQLASYVPPDSLAPPVFGPPTAPGTPVAPSIPVGGTPISTPPIGVPGVPITPVAPVPPPPVPEPSSLVLLLTGAVSALPFLRRRTS